MWDDTKLDHDFGPRAIFFTIFMPKLDQITLTSSMEVITKPDVAHQSPQYLQQLFALMSRAS